VEEAVALFFVLGDELGDLGAVFYAGLWFAQADSIDWYA
jgi:hypothetical protein